MVLPALGALSLLVLPMFALNARSMHDKSAHILWRIFAVAAFTYLFWIVMALFQLFIGSLGLPAHHSSMFAISAKDLTAIRTAGGDPIVIGHGRQLRWPDAVLEGLHLILVETHPLLCAPSGKSIFAAVVQQVLGLPEGSLPSVWVGDDHAPLLLAVPHNRGRAS